MTEFLIGVIVGVVACWGVLYATEALFGRLNP